MKRNTTLTVMLMMGSIAAAVAAPELPADIATVACAEQIAIAPALPLAAREGVQRATNKTQTSSSVSRQDAQAVCETDVTAPYRQAHHGGMKVVPVCRVMATT
ncbi:hypothetical protein [Piscinibacter sakaiensis]|uniref:hypothetical protein n=1 Tax=Piscinibacter sakaiensis TaxID=1547922 RepID=UPI003AACB5B8